MKSIVEEVKDVFGEDCLAEAEEALKDDQVDKKVEEKPTAEKHQLKLLVFLSSVFSILIHAV